MWGHVFKAYFLVLLILPPIFVTVSRSRTDSRYIHAHTENDECHEQQAA